MSAKKNETEPRKLPVGNMIAECCMEVGADSGHMHMTMDCADVSEGDKKLGEISSIVGGGVEIRFADGYCYHLGLRTIWESVSAAHEAWKAKR